MLKLNLSILRGVGIVLACRVRCRKARLEARVTSSFKACLLPTTSDHTGYLQCYSNISFKTGPSIQRQPQLKATLISITSTPSSFSSPLFPLCPCMLRVSTRNLSGSSKAPLKYFTKTLQVLPRLSPPPSLLSNYSTNSRKMTPSSTAFCQALKLKYPIICPPMANCAGGVLAAEVSKAGGLGLIGNAVRSKLSRG